MSNRDVSWEERHGARCRNRILAALPELSWERLKPYMSRVLLHQGAILQENNAAIEHVYFIETGLISLVVDAPDGAQVEAGVTGPEGMVGIAAVLGPHPSFHRAVVQIRGHAYRLPVDILRAEWKRSPQLQEVLHHYLYVLLAQASQAALCHSTHRLEERLSRWLLTVQDRIQCDDLQLTHEDISHLLGVRRSGVTVALNALQEVGFIDTRRGRITIVNGKQLEQCSCECYGVIHHQFQMFTNKIAA